MNLARLLVADGWRVRAFDDLSSGSADDASAAGFDDVVVGDVRDLDGLTAAAEGADAVVHLAAQTGVIPSIENPVRDVDVNVVGTVNALLAARESRATRFVFASSSAPLGAIEPPAHEQVLPRPLSPYGASKLAGEAMCSAFRGSYGMNAVAVRFSNVYGPFSYHKGSVVATFIRAALAGEHIVVYGDGAQTRDFIFVEDLCAGIVAALTAETAPPLVTLGTGVETTVNQLVSALRSLMAERTIEVEYRPERTGEIRRSYCDISLARRELGFDPATSLRDGLDRTLRWFLGGK